MRRHRTVLRLTQAAAEFGPEEPKAQERPSTSYFHVCLYRCNF